MPTWPNWRDIPNIRALGNIRSRKSYAIQSQYSASPIMLALMDGFQKRLDPTDDIDLFYNLVFNIYTAVGWGLDNWGRIVQIGRTIDVDGTTVTLDDEHYRLLLLYKAMANIASSDIATLNSLLLELKDTGIGGFTMPAYVLEVDTMVIRWVFEDFLTPLQQAIFKTAGTLARGAGVGWEMYAINPDAVFGFDGSEMHPFDQAPFAPDTALISGNNNA